MPGYLGDEEYFRVKFSKFFSTNLMKASSRDIQITTEQEDILDILHKKVKPFILRRDKMNVLNELPPKIIQDYYCKMTDIQVIYYVYSNLYLNTLTLGKSL